MIALIIGALLMCAGFSVFVLLALHRLSTERDRQDGAAIRYVRGRR